MIAIAIAPTVAAQLFGRLAGLVTLVVAVPVAIGMTTGMWPGSSGHHRYPAAVVIVDQSRRPRLVQRDHPV